MQTTPLCPKYKMEIQKVFSNIEDPEENLYSVLMTEDEVALYSEMIEELQMYSEEEEDRGKNLRRAGNAALAGTVAAGTYGAYQGIKGHDMINKANLTILKHNARNMAASSPFFKGTRTTSQEAFKRHKAMVEKKVAPIAKKSKIATGVAAAGLATGLGLKIAANRKKNKDN